MSKVVVFAFLAFLLILPLAAPVAAKQVFLSDGGIIECQSFGLLDGNVRVLVNRDVVVDLSTHEVDMKRTFKHKAAKKKQKPPAAKHAVSARPMAKNPAKAGGPMLPVPVASEPASKVATAPGPEAQPANPAAQAAQTPPVNPVIHPMPSRTPAPQQTVAPRSQPPAMLSDPATNKDLQRMNEQMEKGVADTVTHTVSNVPLLILKGIWLFFTTPLGLFVLLLITLTIATLWKVFAKAGEDGWKGIIPIYNLFVLMKIAGKPWWWGVLLFVPLVGFVIAIFYNLSLAGRFGKSQLFGLGLCFLPTVFFGILAFGDAEFNTALPSNQFD